MQLNFTIFFTPKIIMVKMNIENEGVKSLKNNLNLSCSSNKRGQKKNLSSEEPTQQDLCDTILLIKQQIPERSLQKAIEMMFDYVVKKKTPEKVFCDYIPPLLHIPEALKNYRYQPRRKSQIVITYRKEELLRKHFKSKQEKNEYDLMRQIAKSYIIHNGNFQMAEKAFTNSKNRLKERVGSEDLNQFRYKKILKQCLEMNFRQLERFLLQHKIIKLQYLPEEEVEKIVDHILDEKASNYLYVIKNYLRFVFGLSEVVTLKEIESVQLYLELMKHLYRKRLDAEGIELYFSEYFGKTMKRTTKTNPNHLKEDNFIYENYKEFKSFGRLFQELKKKFQWSQSQSKQRLCFLIDRALQKMIQQSKKANINFPHLSPSKRSLLCHNILYNKDACDLRVNLLQFYITPTSQQQSEDDLFILVQITKEFINIESSPQDEITSFNSEGEESREEVTRQSRQL